MNLKAARLLITIAITILLITGTAVAILFAKGYRPSLKNKNIEGTGLLSATSYPPSAQVYINDRLTTVTDDTLNLLPDTYTIKITKDGFIPWQKQLNIHKEFVTTASPRLFPAVPSLNALITNPIALTTPSPDAKKLAFIIPEAESDEGVGLFIYDTSNPTIAFAKNPLRISALPQNYDPTLTSLTWSPDSKQILLLTTSKKQIITGSYLLRTDSFNNLSSTPDSTIRLPLIFSQWEELLFNSQQESLKLVPDELKNYLSTKAANIFFSPDNEKLTYTALADFILKENLIPPVDSINSSPQQRNLKKNGIYVYDTLEDTNYLLGQTTLKDSALLPTTLITPTLTTPTPNVVSTLAGATSRLLFTSLQKGKTTLQTLNYFQNYLNPLATKTPVWYPTSTHLVSLNDNKITIFEYDFQNPATVYSGPFSDSFVFPSPSGNRLYLITNLGQTDKPSTLYSLDLK